MSADGICENCPARDGTYSLRSVRGTTPNVPATLSFYAARREWNPISKSDETVRAAASAALRYVGINEIVEEVLDVDTPVEDGTQCAKAFYDRHCTAPDEEWMEANDHHNPRTNPRLLDIISTDYWHS